MPDRPTDERLKRLAGLNLSDECHSMAVELLELRKWASRVRQLWNDGPIKTCDLPWVETMDDLMEEPIDDAK